MCRELGYSYGVSGETIPVCIRTPTIAHVVCIPHTSRALVAFQGDLRYVYTCVMIRRLHWKNVLFSLVPRLSPLVYARIAI